jgi:hypothetical protein
MAFWNFRHAKSHAPLILDQFIVEISDVRDFLCVSILFVEFGFGVGCNVVTVGGFGYYARETEQGNEVREYHQAVEEVGEVPNEVNLERGADDDAGYYDASVNLDCLVSEQRLDVLLTKEVPTDNRRECEEQEADCYEDRACVADGCGERSLCERCSLKSAFYASLKLSRCEDNHSCEREYDECIDEYGNDCDFALILRAFNLCECVGVRS